MLAKSSGGGVFAPTRMLDFHGSLAWVSRGFITATGDGSACCAASITGLVKTEAGKRNLERSNEEFDISGDGYQRIQQFISDAPWSAAAVTSHIAQNTLQGYAGQPDDRRRDVGYIIDESAHRKKGRHCVGVARQSAGVMGKVENCQVGIYASLGLRTHSTRVNCRLFLPQV